MCSGDSWLARRSVRVRRAAGAPSDRMTARGRGTATNERAQCRRTDSARTTGQGVACHDW